MSIRLLTGLFTPDAKRANHWWSIILPVAVFISFNVTQACAKIIDSVAEIPTGPGQVCVKYVSGYSSLLDWIGGPKELGLYQYISYDYVVFFQTVHSCVGGAQYPGSLQEGNFFMLGGGLHGGIHINQAEIVNIQRIPNNCPYMLTYYKLTNPVVIPDPSGTCVKGLPPDKNKNQDGPDICQ